MLLLLFFFYKGAHTDCKKNAVKDKYTHIKNKGNNLKRKKEKKSLP